MWGCKCYVHVCAQIQVSRIETCVSCFRWMQCLHLAVRTLFHIRSFPSTIQIVDRHKVSRHNTSNLPSLPTFLSLHPQSPPPFTSFPSTLHLLPLHPSPPSPPPFTSFPSTLHLLPLHPSPPSPPPFTSFHLLPHLSSSSPHLPSSLHTSHTHHDTTAHLHMQRSSVHPHRRQWWVLSHPFVRPSELCRPGLHRWLPGVVVQLAPCRRGHRQ